MSLRFEVGALTIEMPQFKSFDAHRKHLYLIDNDGKDEALIRMRFVQVLFWVSVLALDENYILPIGLRFIRISIFNDF